MTYPKLSRLPGMTIMEINSNDSLCFSNDILHSISLNGMLLLDTDTDFEIYAASLVLDVVIQDNPKGAC